MRRNRTREMLGVWPECVALVAICLAAYLPGFFSLPPVDRDESRFAQASRQMIESATWEGFLIPRIQNAVRLNKPPLIYWCQASVGWLLGEAQPQPLAGAGSPRWGGRIWVYRLPSLMAALVAVVATWRLGCSLFDRRAAWLGAVLLGCCPMVAWDARQARADQLLLAATVVAQWLLWSIWSHRNRTDGSWWRPMLFWLAVGAGIMTKGPITPMIVGMTVLFQSLVCREWRWIMRLRPLAGALIIAALVGSWVYLVAERVGWGRYLSAIIDETLGRGVIVKEGHWGPPAYHLGLATILFWPGSLLSAHALLRAWRRGVRTPAVTAGVGRSDVWQRLRLARAGRGAELFCLAWIVPSWVVFELARTKLPHYTMPLYPALALLTGRAVFAIAPGTVRGIEQTALRCMVALWLAIGGALGVAAPLALWWSADVERWSLVTVWTFVAALIVASLLVAAWRAFRADRPPHTMAASIAALLIACSSIFTLLPRLDAIWLSPRLLALLESADPSATRPIAAVAYQEDSLVFLSRGRVQRINDTDLDRWLVEHAGGLAIVPSERQFSTLQVRRLGEAPGFNYSKGTWLRLSVIEAVQQPPAANLPKR